MSESLGRLTGTGTATLHDSFPLVPLPNKAYGGTKGLTTLPADQNQGPEPEPRKTSPTR